MAKKFYWLKLKDSFFSSREIKKLRSIAGGDTFTIIYLKMQLLSIKNGGIIEFEGTENDISEQLSIELDEELENVKLTLTFLMNNRLIEELEDDEFLLNKVPELIGKETDTAERMRKMREQRNIVTPLLQDVTQREEKREKKEENREKKEELDMADKPLKPPKIVKHKYGEYENVLLSDEDSQKLISEFPNDYQDRIERLSGYIASTGKSYKNHLATIRNWAKSDEEKPKSTLRPVVVPDDWNFTDLEIT